MVPENLIPIGIFVIFLGFIIVFIGMLLNSRGSKESKVDWVFGGFIGPVPFGFASREDWLKLIITISLIFLVIFILLNRKML